MSILWCGGEDIDFPNGGPVTSDTSGIYYRPAYARCAIRPASTPMMKSDVFPGGAVTSCWMGVRIGMDNVGLIAGNAKLIGLGQSGTNSGLFLGTGVSVGNKATIYKYDGVTTTALAAETGTTWAQGVWRWDLQLINYGASGTINVYYGGSLLFTYTGDLSITGVTGFDSVFICDASNTWNHPMYSEIMVSDLDTRPYSLATSYPNGVGTHTDWTGAYTDIDEVTASTSDIVSAATAGLVSTYAMSDLPAGNDKVVAVAVKAQASCGATGPQNMDVAIRTNSTDVFGADTPLTDVVSTVAHIWNSNPYTNQKWQRAEVNAIEAGARSVT